MTAATPDELAALERALAQAAAAVPMVAAYRFGSRATGTVPGPHRADLASFGRAMPALVACSPDSGGGA